MDIGFISLQRREAQYEVVLSGDPCSYCGSPVAGEIDHIHPRVDGGVSGGWENLTSACGRCNKSKSSTDLLGYLWRRAAPPSSTSRVKGVRRRPNGIWSANAPNSDGIWVRLGYFPEEDLAIEAVEQYRAAHPVRPRPPTPAQVAREELRQRIKEMWNDGMTMRAIGEVEGISTQAVARRIEEMRNRGDEDVAFVGQGGGGKRRPPRKRRRQGYGYGYVHQPKKGEPPWLVQVGQGRRGLRARFETEDEARTAVARFRSANEQPARSRVEEARVRAGLSQGELAKRIGVTLGTVANIERQMTASPHRKTREALARVLGVFEGELFAEFDAPGGKPVRIFSSRVVGDVKADPERPWLLVTRYTTKAEAEAALALLRGG